jgi:hypothetical protein
MDLERLDVLARAASPAASGAIELTGALLAELQWDKEDAEQILRGLGFARVRKSDDAVPALWRRRSAGRAQSDVASTPFAALAALARPEPLAKRRAPRRLRRRANALGRRIP